MAAVIATLGCGNALAQTPIERLQADAPQSWGKWGEQDEIGALNLIIRTGSMERYFDENEETAAAWDAMTEPGLCYNRELVEWFADMETPMIAADNLAVEKVVQEIDGETDIIPLHAALIRDLGIVLSELYWLQEIAEASAGRSVPLLVRGRPPCRWSREPARR